MKSLLRLPSFLLVFLACWSALLADSLVQIHIPLGDMLVVLYDQDKPVTVANFRAYIESGRFKDSFVQRWEPGFVIQGGGYFVTNRATANALIDLVPTYPPIVNEYGVGRTFSNVYGTMAMARVGGKTNSATSQWFLNLGNNAGLDSVDGGFTVFGAVMAGTNVLERFNNLNAATNGVWLYKELGGALSKLPVLSPNPSINDLVYTSFSLPAWPRVKFAMDPDGTRRLSWNSLSNFVNHLEFSATVPPVWTTLVNTNGTGGTIEVKDARPAAGRGIYRVRIE